MENLIPFLPYVLVMYLIYTYFLDKCVGAFVFKYRITKYLVRTLEFFLTYAISAALPAFSVIHLIIPGILFFVILSLSFYEQKYFINYLPSLEQYNKPSFVIMATYLIFFTMILGISTVEPDIALHFTVNCYILGAVSYIASMIQKEIQLASPKKRL